MPYKVKKVKGGWKTFSPSGPKSKKPLTLRRARAQQKAIYANTQENTDEDGSTDNPMTEE